MVHDPHIVRLFQADLSYQPLLVTPTTSSSLRPDLNHFNHWDQVLQGEPQEAIPFSSSEIKDNPYCYLLLEDGEANVATWRKKLKIPEIPSETTGFRTSVIGTLFPSFPGFTCLTCS